MRTTLLLALALTLAACGEKDAVDSGPADADGDGFDVDLDCDDNDPASYPGAPEACDGVDNNCDGSVDELPSEGPSWYGDADGDGFGGASFEIIACEQPTGYVDNADDCDDLNASTYPGGAEVCDGLDNDCNGTADDNASDSLTFFEDLDGDGFGTDANTADGCYAPSGFADNADDCDDSDAEVNPDTVWYSDLDSDGFGSSAFTSASCEQPSGYVADSSDCDDLNADNYPGADEYCDGVDNNCDGTTDEDSALDALLWYTDGDGDGFGDEASEVTACDQPSGSLGVGGDCDDASTDIYPGAPEICEDGIDQDCNGRADNTCLVGYGLADASAAVAGNDTFDYAGYGVAILGDTDGDGAAEIAVGAYSDDDNGTSSGTTFIFNGPVSGIYSGVDADTFIAGDNSYDYLGRTVVGPGDVNGDGYGDLLVSAYGNDDGATSAGAVYLMHGPLTTGAAGDVADAAFYGAVSSDGLGFYMRNTIGDMDNDGYADIMLDAYTSDPGGNSSAGTAYFFYGPVSGDYSANEADGIIEGHQSSARFGRAVSSAGDQNGDGYTDVIVGWPYDQTSVGTAYLFHGPITGTITNADADAEYDGNTSTDYTGSQVGSAGDVNNDGYDDVMVGAYSTDTGATSGGTIYLLHGPVSGTGTLTASAAFSMHGVSSSDNLGYYGSQMSHGDFDGDGYDDIVFGVPKDNGGGSDAGAVYIVYGPMEGSFTTAQADVGFWGDASSQNVGQDFDVADIDGDGTDDLLIGASGATSSAGGAALYYGSDL